MKKTLITALLTVSGILTQPQAFAYVLYDTGGIGVSGMSSNGSQSTIYAYSSVGALTADVFGNIYTLPSGGINIITPVAGFSTFYGYGNFQSITTDTLGNVYAASVTGGINKFTSDGSISVFYGYGNFKSITADAIGNLYGASATGGINKFSSDGSISVFYGYNTFKSISSDIFGNIYAIDSSGKLDEISSQGTFSSLLQGLGSFTAVTVDKSQNIYTLGTYNYNTGITEIDTNGVVSSYSLGGITAITAATPAIPEPSTYALLGIGSIGLLMVMRRKKTV